MILLFGAIRDSSVVSHSPATCLSRTGTLTPSNLRWRSVTFRSACCEVFAVVGSCMKYGGMRHTWQETANTWDPRYSKTIVGRKRRSTARLHVVVMPSLLILGCWILPAWREVQFDLWNTKIGEMQWMILQTELQCELHGVRLDAKLALHDRKNEALVCRPTRTQKIHCWNMFRCEGASSLCMPAIRLVSVTEYPQNQHHQE